tara:strand:- start:337 stop:471 length:135 start_codon:yes stop_codon:yes gene_type:complete
MNFFNIIITHKGQLLSFTSAIAKFNEEKIYNKNKVDNNFFIFLY